MFLKELYHRKQQQLRLKGTGKVQNEKSSYASLVSKQAQKTMWLQTRTKKDNSEDKTKSQQDRIKSHRKYSQEAGFRTNQGSGDIFQAESQSFCETVAAMCLRIFFSFLNRNAYCGSPVSFLSLCSRFFGEKGRNSVENLSIEFTQFQSERNHTHEMIPKEHHNTWI